MAAAHANPPSGTAMAARLVLLLAVMAATAHADHRYKYAFAAKLKGAFEAPKPVNTLAYGNSELYVWDKYATVKVWLYNIKAFQVLHLHFAGPAGNPTGFGLPAILWFIPFTPNQSLNPPLTIKGSLYAEVTFNGTDLQQPQLFNGSTNADDRFATFTRWLKNNSVYINAHTVQNTAGEIRGNYVKYSK